MARNIPLPPAPQRRSYAVSLALRRVPVVDLAAGRRDAFADMFQQALPNSLAKNNAVGFLARRLLGGQDDEIFFPLVEGDMNSLPFLWPNPSRLGPVIIVLA